MDRETEALLQHASALREAGELEQAIAAYSQVLQRKPDLPESWYNLGWLQRRAGRFEEALRSYVEKLNPADPTRPLLSNADGEVVASGEEYLRRLVSQVTRPVRWDLTMDGLAALGVDRTIELPPAGTLTGLVRRALKGTVTTPFAVKTPANLEELS